MEIIVVRYKVQASYVARNKANIRAVMEYLRKHPIDPLHWYWVSNAEDDQTFEHYAMANSRETIAKINEIEVFKKFRKELIESKPMQSPKQFKRTMLDNNFSTES